MKIPYQDEPRKVVPRWRDSRTSARLGELDGVGSNKPVPLLRDEVLSLRKAEWESHRTLAYAADYLATAIVMDRLSPARDAIDFILAHTENGAQGGLRDLAIFARERLGGTPNVTQVQYPLFYVSPDELVARVRALRKRLHEEPRNAVSWIDLALAYTALGQHRPATRAMGIALTLTPDNRFVLRSASRFFVHLKEQDRALRVLRASDASRSDPWLAAAEIAVADSIGRTPRRVKEGRRLVKSKALSSFATSELASALGTLELGAGSGKEAKRLIRASVIDPTDNSLAQIEWVARETKSFEFDRTRLEAVEAAHEAKALSAFGEGDWQRSFNNSLLWLRDEPFSSNASALGSYIALICLGDHEQALRVLEAGLIANPDNWLLLNNKAFAFVNLNRVDDAAAVLNKIRTAHLDEDQRAVIRATQGAVHFRRREYGAGRAAYREAVKAFSSRPNGRSRALAMLCWAREEALAGQPYGAEVVGAAIGSSDRLVGDNPDIRALSNEVAKLSELLSTHVVGAGGTYKP